MVFEDLVRAPQDFVKNVVEFVGEKNVLEHDHSLKKPAPSNLFNELLRYINIFTKIVSLSGFDDLCKKIMKNENNAFSFRFRKFCYRWGITIDDRIFKKLGIAGRYQYGFKNVLPQIRATYALNNKKLSKLIGKDLSIYNYPIN